VLELPIALVDQVHAPHHLSEPVLGELQLLLLEEECKCSSLQCVGELHAERAYLVVRQITSQQARRGAGEEQDAYAAAAAAVAPRC
jgi:hypothetical protein